MIEIKIEVILMNLVTLKNKIKSGVVVSGLLVTIIPNLVNADQVEPHNDPIWNRYGYVTTSTTSEKQQESLTTMDNSQNTNVDAERKAAEDLANYWAHYDWSKHVSSWSNSSTSYNRYGYIMYP